jgi:hypothetical protein
VLNDFAFGFKLGVLVTLCLVVVVAIALSYQ